MVGSVYNLGKEDNIWILIRYENDALGIVGCSYSFSALGHGGGIIRAKSTIGFHRGVSFWERFDASRSRLRDRLFKGVSYLRTLFTQR